MVTYYENLTFPMFKCYNRVTDAYQPRKHEKEQPTNLEACEKISCSDSDAPVM